MTTGFDVEASAGLTFQIGRLARVLEAQQAWQQRVDAATRYIKPPPKQATVSASGVATFGFEGPKTGYVWTVRRITVSDSAAMTTATTGTAYVYAGISSGSAYLVPDNCEWIITPLPNTANFSSDQLVLQYGEHLYVQITGGTNGQVVKASIAYQLYTPITGTPIAQV